MAKRALVLGSQIGGLTGVDNDTQRVREMLEQDHFQVDLRTGANATRDGILDGYKRLIKESGHEDTVVIYYSGHGHYAVNLDRNTDRPVLQGISPTDYEDSTESDYRGISSWELSILLAKLTDDKKTKNTTVILDCCHSSQMSRDAAVRDAVARAFPHPLHIGFGPYLARLEADYPGGLASISPTGNPDAVRVVACGRSESAFEYTNKRGMRTGAFTEALLDILAELGKVTISWEALGRAIRERVLRAFPSQRPDVEGPIRRQLFSTVLDDDSGIVSISPGSDGLVLAAGRLQGVSDGDVFGVMPVGSRDFQRESGIALVTVRRALGTTAQAAVTEWLNDNKTVPKNAVALPQAIAAPKRTLELFVPVGADRGPIEKAIDDARTLRIATPGDSDRPIAALRLEEGKLTIEDAKGALFPPAAYLSELAGTVRNLRNLGVAQALRELEGEHGILASDVEVELGFVEGAAMCAMPERGGSLGLGDRVCLRVKSASHGTLYVHIFNVGVRGTVSLLTSYAASGIALERGEQYILGTDDATRKLTGLELFWPDGLPMESFPRIDEMIVIVTSTRVNLTGLETNEFISRSAKRAPGSRLQDLVTQLQDGLTRDSRRNAPPERFLVKRLWYFLHPRRGQIGEIDFEIDENPQLQSSARAASAWVTAREAKTAIADPVGAVAIRLGELVVDKNHALFSADVRVDALVVTRAESEPGAYRVTTMPFKRIKSGERLPLDNALLFLGPVRDFVDICLWVSRDNDSGLQLADLFAQQSSSPEFRDAATALLIAVGVVAAPWVTAVGASAVLARMAYKLLLEAAGTSIGLYRTSFLAHERFGVGRHPKRDLHVAQHFSFSLLIEPVKSPSNKN